MACNTGKGTKPFLNMVAKSIGLRITEDDWHELRLAAERREGPLSRALASPQQITDALDRLADDLGHDEEAVPFGVRAKAYSLARNALLRTDAEGNRTEVTVGTVQTIAYMSRHSTRHAVETAKQAAKGKRLAAKKNAAKTGPKLVKEVTHVPRDERHHPGQHPVYGGYNWGVQYSDGWGDYQVNHGYFGSSEQAKDGSVYVDGSGVPMSPDDVRWSSDQRSEKDAILLWNHREFVSEALRKQGFSPSRHVRISAKIDRDAGTITLGNFDYPGRTPETVIRIVK